MSYKVKREYKSNSFSLLMKNKKYALQVYNCLNGSNYSGESDICIVEIKNGVALSVKGDALFLVDNYINFYEHQSTINPNMPLRNIIYASEYYSFYVKTNDRNIYGRSLIKIPEPKLVVFYNGVDKFPAEKVLKLSDSFINRTEGPYDIEAVCHVYNINPGEDHFLYNSCQAINGYTTYVERVREYMNDVYMSEESIENAVKRAVDDCIKNHILADFFLENKDRIIADDVLDCTFENRLRMDLQDQAREYSKIISGIISEKDGIISEKDEIISEKDEIISEKDDIIEKYKSKFGEL